VPKNAYLPGWPVKVVNALPELRPYVGSGVDTPPALAAMTCPLNSSPGLKVGVFSSDGPAYVFGSDGKSCYGQAPDRFGNMQDRVLGTTARHGDSNDTPYIEAVGNAAFGDLSGSGDLVLVAPTAGIGKTTDVLLSEHQFNAQNQITAWALAGVPPGAVPQAHPGFPHYMNDLMFLAGPAIADLTGLGPQEVIMGSASSDLRAVTPAGLDLPGWSKNTGGWSVSTAAVGTVGTDQHQKVASLTREGTVFLWQTAAPACAGASWPKYKHDIWNSGEFETQAGRPATITDLKTSRNLDKATLTFTAPQGNLFCGNASGYEIRYSTSGPITDANWQAAQKVGNSGPGCVAGSLKALPAGKAQSITLSGCPAGTIYFDVQAYNSASRAGGNLGAISTTPKPHAPLAPPLWPALLFSLSGLLGLGRQQNRSEVRPA
jgi:hypothetical protein